MHRHIFASALLLVSVVTPARAESQEIIITVPAHQLGGAMPQALRHRIGLAVEQVCGNYSTVERDEWQGMDACYAGAWRSVDRQIASLKGSGAIRVAAR